MGNKARSKKHLARRSPRYTPRECVLIVCEDGKASPKYFTRLRVELSRLKPMLDVRVVGAGSGPSGVVDAASRDVEERDRRAAASVLVLGYERIWCVMDVEAPGPRKSLDAALRAAAAQGFSPALSNPCFEYWLLLHFEARGSHFHHSRDVPQAIKRHVNGYTKGADIFETVYPLTDTAIANAKTVLRSKGNPRDLTGCNPSTHVYRVVEHLWSMLQD